MKLLTILILISLYVAGLFACSGNSTNPNNAVSEAALQDSIYAHLKDSILGDFSKAGYDSLVADSVYNRLYASFYNAEMQKLHAHYDSVVAAKIDSVAGNRDSALRVQDSLEKVSLDSLRTNLYDSLYKQVYFDLYSQDAGNYLRTTDFWVSSMLNPSVYPYLGQVYAGYLHYQNLGGIILHNYSTTNSYSVALELEVPGVTQVSSTMGFLAPGASDTLQGLPALIWSALANLEDPENLQMNVRLKVYKNEQANVLWSASYPLRVEPANMRSEYYVMSDSTYPNLDSYLAGWVQSSSDSVVALIKSAILYETAGAFDGYQNPGHVQDSASLVRAQVQAIYQALQAKQIAYVTYTLSSAGQKIKVPDQVLRSSAANCIDGTLLFAAALEAVGIQPIVYVIPSHAFLGWRVGDGSRQVEYLETTDTWNGATFDQAQADGLQRHTAEVQAGDFSSGLSDSNDIFALHTQGVLPFPIALTF